MPRGANAYMMFVKEKRAGVVASLKTNDISTIGKKLGEMWRALSEKEKLHYKELAAKHVPAAKPIKAKTGGKRKLNGYMKFAIKNRPLVKAAHPNMEPKKIMSKLGEMWRALSIAEKAKYD